ncbi:hypothetical protein M8J77_013100 [Diaphorina citri]|nr:hypothetical protein M8J77_013100 [Diaphorina citri]
MANLFSSVGQLLRVYISRGLSSITIEPALFISFITSQISQVGRANLVLQKLCYHNGTGPVLGVICPNEVAIQKKVALVDSYRITLVIATKMIILILSSTWKTSRIPFFLLPMLGHILLDILNIGCTYWWQSSIWIQALGTGLLTGITGVGTLMLIGCTLYASDNTSPSDRTLRIAIYQGLYAFSVPLGDYTSGYLMVALGFYPVFLISAVGNVISIYLIWKKMKGNDLKAMVDVPEGGRYNSSYVPENEGTCSDQGHISNSGDNPRVHNVQTGIANRGSEVIAGVADSGNKTAHVQDTNNSDKSISRHLRDLDADIDKITVTLDHGILPNSNHLEGTSDSDRHRTGVDSKGGLTNVHNGIHRRNDSRSYGGCDRQIRSGQDSTSGYQGTSFLSKTFKPLFNLCVNNFKVLVKPRDNYRTTITLLMTLTSVVLSSSLIGEYSLLYYYVRAKFGWTEKDYGEYAAYKAWAATVGVMFAVGVLGKLCKVKDTTIGLLACVSDMLECIFYMFVNTPVLMYVVPLVDMFHGAAFTVSVSTVTKEIDLNELSSVLLAQNLLTSFAPIVVTNLYMMVYRHTVDVWPAAFFALGAALSIPAFISFITVKKLHRRRRLSPSREQQQDTVNN